jgi:hypothetical protein
MFKIPVLHCSVIYCEVEIVSSAYPLLGGLWMDENYVS